ncbi:hypothetical protein [Pseudomonas oryzihabitans]|uniref:hypothetical protein n=1 Tax=Pseudomonas oryzihabitans TaxID=47885 RepID=UPI00241FB0D7|nr:hypothetical protein [Pseudomonas oryzihabitans]
MSTENIDWSKAPEGATHWGPETHSHRACWYMQSAGGWLFSLAHQGLGWLEKDHIEPYRLNQLVARPAAPWSGEGLPPIGSVCEMLSHGEEESEWIEVQILAHTKINGEDHAVFQYEEHVGTGSVQGSCFRPVRTDQERGVDLVLSEIEALYAEGGSAAIYDAGYRKVDPAGAQP